MRHYVSPIFPAEPNSPSYTISPLLCCFPWLSLMHSPVHYMASFACRNAHGPLLKAISDQSNFSLLDQYNVTKLLDVYLAREIALLPDARSVVVNSVNPGLCKSELRRSSSIPNLVK